MAITFRPMTREDLPLVHEWHQRPHVIRWWTVRRTLEETEAHYLPTIEGTEPTEHYFASLRAFEKAGFRAVREFVDPEDNELHALVRRERD
jgi:microsomal dipeptidase-like Zn-dependent dipeptidase